jgi:non-specific serine/threonine protein kinase
VDESSALSLLGIAEAAAPELTWPDSKRTIERLETRTDDLGSAISWFVDAGRPDEALRLANALYRFWNTTRRFADGDRWLGAVLASDEGDEGLRGRAHLYAGFMSFWMGDDERARERFERALDVGRAVGDPPLVSQALGGLSRVALRTDVPLGRKLAREALDVSTTAGDENGRSNALHLLGVGAQIAGDLVEARDWMTQRLALVRPTGNEFLIASEACNLSMVERQLGDLDAAEALAQEALEIERRAGTSFTTPFAFSGLGAIAVERGHLERAATLIGAAEAAMEATAMAWPPDERPHYERTLATLDADMDAGTFERSRAAGHAMPIAEAVDYALAGAPTPGAG